MFQFVALSLALCNWIVDAQLMSVSELTFDENDHLDTNMVLFSHEKCKENVKFQSDLINTLGTHITSSSISGELEAWLLGENIVEHASFSDSTHCSAIFLERGTLKDQLHYPTPEHMFHMPSGSDESFFPVMGQTGAGSISMEEIGLHIWLNSLTVVEVGWISYLPGEGTLYWIDRNNQRIFNSPIRYGERETHWITSHLGHRFEIVGKDGSIWWTNDFDVDESLPRGTQEGNVVSRIEDVGCRFPTIYVLGSPGTGIRPSLNQSRSIYSTFKHEWVRSRNTKRTFTPLGFAHSKLPLDLYASMSTYYYNNAENRVREEWGDKGVFVNWWQADCFMIGMPWGLKKYWQGRLKTLVENWIGGIPLDLTDIYGMRRYEDGASLLAHVDREETHAVSLIINVAQGGMRKPWNIEIYDHADRLHEMEMQPGDIVFYESAKALHSRTDPLQGDYYVNLFSHYRPSGGDNRWYMKQNPPDAPKQLLDIGDCSVDDQNAVHCTKADIPSLSPKLQTIHSGDDLFKYWQSVMVNHPKTISSVRNDVKPSDFGHNEL